MSVIEGHARFLQPLPPTRESLNAQIRYWSKDYSENEIARFSGDRNNLCGNCGLTTHRFAECYGPLNEDWLLFGCPIHGTHKHSFDECWHPTAFTHENLLLYLYTKRIGKPMLDSKHYSTLERSLGPMDFRLPITVRPLSRREVQEQFSSLKIWKDDPFYLDLHGRNVPHIFDILREKIWPMQGRGQTHLRVIIGQGKHSKDNISKLKHEVERFCERSRYKYDVEDNPGRICIYPIAME